MMTISRIFMLYVIYDTLCIICTKSIVCMFVLANYHWYQTIGILWTEHQICRFFLQINLGIEKYYASAEVFSSLHYVNFILKQFSSLRSPWMETARCTLQDDDQGVSTIKWSAMYTLVHFRWYELYRLWQDM